MSKNTQISIPKLLSLIIVLGIVVGLLTFGLNYIFRIESGSIIRPILGGGIAGLVSVCSIIYISSSLKKGRRPSNTTQPPEVLLK